MLLLVSKVHVLSHSKTCCVRVCLSIYELEGLVLPFIRVVGSSKDYEDLRGMDYYG